MLNGEIQIADRPIKSPFGKPLCKCYDSPSLVTGEGGGVMANLQGNGQKSLAGYIPPLTRSGSNLSLNPPEITPGGRGYAIKQKGLVYIPLILAEHEGNGDIGRFLDSLAPCCVIAGCVNMRLLGMLQRRGWREDSYDVLSKPQGSLAKGDL